MSRITSLFVGLSFVVCCVLCFVFLRQFVSTASVKEAQVQQSAKQAEPQADVVGKLQDEEKQRFDDLATEFEKASVLLKADLKTFEKTNKNAKMLKSLTDQRNAAWKQVADRFKLPIQCLIANVQNEEQHKRCPKIWGIEQDGTVLTLR